ncbi:Ni/Fe hydrogenase subunit alpha [Pyrodictium occultum]|uniref:Ni/Fe hydrogenase subunit alpha n=1 Tax=Pyrodictium occultum TaxID=2309 RepID=UPI001F017301|nr:nickel-dependent hydrogenase large subunit [Pyrodictium occultum]
MDQVERKSEERRRKLRKLLVTLIEGHAYVVFKTGEDGRVEDVLFEGVDTRMFETMWIGMSIDELPRVTPMICGVCSATHHVASVKALDGVRKAEAPEDAWRIRYMINYGIHLNNQVLHPLVFGLPDFLPPDEEGKRSVMALSKRYPEAVRAGVMLAELGHRVVAVYGGRDIHPINAIAGGVARKPPSAEIDRLKSLFAKHRGDLEVFVKTAIKIMEDAKHKIGEYKPGFNYMLALAGENREYDIVNGRVRLLDARTGSVVAEFGDRTTEYLDYLYEYSVPYSYIRMVTTKWKARSPREGTIHTSALARANLVKSYGVEWADELRDRLFEEWGRPVTLPLLATYLRVVETVALYEIIERELEKPLGDKIYREPERDTGEGVGIIEAPRGTLIHHYRGEEGRTAFVNIITPTAINAAAIEADLRDYFVGEKLDEMRDRDVYASAVAIARSYDPCMACATHTAHGSPPLRIVVADENWKPLRVIKPG